MKIKNLKITPTPLFPDTGTPVKYAGFESAFKLMCSFENSVIKLNDKNYLVNEGRVSRQQYDWQTYYHIYLRFTVSSVNESGEIISTSQEFAYGTFSELKKSFLAETESYNAVYESKANNVQYWVDLLKIPVVTAVGYLLACWFGNLRNKTFEYRKPNSVFKTATITALYKKETGESSLLWVSVEQMDESKTICELVEMPLSEAIGNLLIDIDILPSQRRQFAKITFLYLMSGEYFTK